jgi:dGTPase
MVSGSCFIDIAPITATTTTTSVVQAAVMIMFLCCFFSDIIMFSVEYLIKLVQKSIDSKKYNELITKEDRISYLRALAIGSLIQDAVRIFMENETAIMNGEFDVSLMEKSQYKAQIDDIIKISVNKIYRSKEVIEKEIIGYKVIHSLLDAFLTAYVNKINANETNFDRLILNLLPQKYQVEKSELYGQLLNICQFISLLTDGKAIELYKIVNANKL